MPDEDYAAIFERFDQDGFARLEQPSEVEHLRDRADMLMQEHHPDLFYQHDADTGRYEDAPLGLGWVGPSDAYRKIEKLDRDSVFASYLACERLRALARHRLGDGVALYRAMLMNKAASIGSDLPWHQDGGAYWGLDREPELQVWTALDEADEESGCLWVVPGSHHDGLVSPLGGVLADPGDADNRAVAVPARAGEIILLHCHVWHRSGPNRSKHQRRAFSVCYIAGNTGCTRKKKPKRRFTRLSEL